MHMKTRSVILLFFILFLSSCNSKQTYNVTEGEKVLVAEEIIYDVVIKTPNAEDPWEVEKLEGYRGDRMIAELFNAVYTKKIKAYDYHSGKRLSPEEVRKAELQAGYDRNNIGKIQFTENWYYNTATMQIEKEVISIVLGYENREIDGTLIGYRAAFKLNLQ